MGGIVDVARHHFNAAGELRGATASANSFLTSMVLAVAAASSAAAQEPSPDVPVGYKLVWADELASDALPDPSKWVFDTHANKGGWYNNELQYYFSERLKNAPVRSGHSLSPHVAKRCRPPLTTAASATPLHA